MEITSKLTKKNAKIWRLILASTLGGVYSFIIFANELPSYILVLSKLMCSMLIIMIAFKFYRVKSFFISLLVFYFSSLIVLGAVVGVYLLTNSRVIAINNSTIYFDISARALLASAFLAYVLSIIIVRLYNKHLSKNEIYTIEIFANGESVTLYAFVDTGNKLREPFSNSPVIIADKEKVECFVNDANTRLIPTSTVSGEAVLTAFKPSKIIVKSSKGREVVENAYVALSSDIKSNSFSAIINPEILSL